MIDPGKRFWGLSYCTLGALCGFCEAWLGAKPAFHSAPAQPRIGAISKGLTDNLESPLGETDHADDAELVQKLLNNDGESWERFIDRYSGFVATVVRRLLQTHKAHASNADVEDISENVFMALMENNARLLERYDPNHKLSTYLGVIARTQCHRWLRSRKPVASFGDDAGNYIADDNQASTTQNLIRGEARAAVRLAMASLNEREQAALRMFYYENVSYQDMARDLGININSIGALLSRARSKLQHELKRVSDMSESDYRAL